MKDQHSKLSKRNGDANFEDFYQKGYLPEAIVNYIALLGWSPKSCDEKLTMQQLIEQFDFEGVNKSPAIFDNEKMMWLNGEYLKEMSDEDFAKLAKPFIENSAGANYDHILLSHLMKTRVEILSQIPEKLSFLADWNGFDLDLFENAKQKCDKTVAKKVLENALPIFRNEEFKSDLLFSKLVDLSVALEIKKNAVLWAVRIALTGSLSTPGGATEMAVLLGKEESIKRLEAVIARL